MHRSFLSALISVFIVFGFNVATYATEFVATKKKGESSFAFSDITTIKTGEGVAFFLTVAEPNNLTVEYLHRGKSQTLFQGPLVTKNTFELPGNGKHIYLEGVGTHTFRFALDSGELFSRSIIISSSDSLGAAVSQAKANIPDTAPSVAVSGEFYLQDVPEFDADVPITPTITRASGSQIYRALSPSVVLVRAEGGFGSGAVLSKNGHILTNHHVIGDAKSVAIITKPPGFQKVILDESRIADVVKVDEEKDLAILVMRQPLTEINPILLNDEVFDVADEVHAIGHPKGNYWTYTKGVISQFRPQHTWIIDGKVHKADIIQTQTPINPGNSGGPLLTSNGKLIGVNTYVTSGADGLNYAVATSSVMNFIKSGLSFKPAKKLQAKKDGKGTLFDVDEDGVPEALAIDNDDNGTFDEFRVDNDLDGRPDVYYVDKNENDVFELIIEMKDVEGKLIAVVMIDKDEDEVAETVGYDYDLDGKIDKYEKG